MFNSIDELKEFITWAKNNNIKSFKIQDVQIEVSEASLIMEESPQELKEASGDTMVDTEKMSQEEIEELLFWSAQK